MNKAASSLSEQAVQEITDMITVQRRFCPGDKLPNEMELSQELGISRITLREAVRVLCTRGLLEVRRGKGTFVCSDRPAVFPDEEEEINLSGVEIQDLLEFLLAAGPAAAWYAAKRGTEEELLHLEELCRNMEEAAAREPDFQTMEPEFYDALSAASHNPLWKRMLSPVSRAVWENGAFQESGAVFLPDYREIVRYLLSRNPEGARRETQMLIFRLWKNAGLDIE